MEMGLAQQMVYGSGSGQTVKHHYAGTTSNKLQKNKGKGRKKSCKKHPS